MLAGVLAAAEELAEALADADADAEAVVDLVVADEDAASVLASSLPQAARNSGAAMKAANATFLEEVRMDKFLLLIFIDGPKTLRIPGLSRKLP